MWVRFSKILKTGRIFRDKFPETIPKNGYLFSAKMTLKMGRGLKLERHTPSKPNLSTQGGSDS